MPARSEEAIVHDVGSQPGCLPRQKQAEAVVPAFNNREAPVSDIGLIFGCPHGEEAPGCPWSVIRELPGRERYQLYSEMSVAELNKLGVQHHICSCRRANGSGRA